MFASLFTTVLYQLGFHNWISQPSLLWSVPYLTSNYVRNIFSHLTPLEFFWNIYKIVHMQMQHLYSSISQQCEFYLLLCFTTIQWHLINTVPHRSLSVFTGSQAKASGECSKWSMTDHIPILQFWLFSRDHSQQSCLRLRKWALLKILCFRGQHNLLHSSQRWTNLWPPLSVQQFIVHLSRCTPCYRIKIQKAEINNTVLWVPMLW